MTKRKSHLKASSGKLILMMKTIMKTETTKEMKKRRVKMKMIRTKKAIPMVTPKTRKILISKLSILLARMASMRLNNSNR